MLSLCLINENLDYITSLTSLHCLIPISIYTGSCAWSFFMPWVKFTIKGKFCASSVTGITVRCFYRLCIICIYCAFGLLQSFTSYKLWNTKQIYKRDYIKYPTGIRARIPMGLQPESHWDYSQNATRITARIHSTSISQYPTGITARIQLGLQQDFHWDYSQNSTRITARIPLVLVSIPLRLQPHWNWDYSQTATGITASILLGLQPESTGNTARIPLGLPTTESQGEFTY